MGVILGLKRAASLGAVLLLCACPSDEGAPPAPIEDVDGDVPRFDSGTRSDAGRDGASEGGGSEGGADAQGDAQGDGGEALGPLVELLEPQAGSVIVGSTLNARCLVERNPDGEPINPSSVKIALYVGEETVAFVTQVATSTAETDVFKADVPLVNAPHGSVRVECSAEDVTQQKHRASQSISAQVDRGPLITFLYPTEDDFVAAGKGAGEDVRVRFKVEPRPLSDDDAAANVAEIEVAVTGKPVMGIEESSTEEHVYSFGLDFSDGSMFTVIPDTFTIRVDASNLRDPAAAAFATLAVGVDSEGPTIVVRSPVSSSGAEPIVSGKVDILLEVNDELAGVDPATVKMVISVPGRSKEYPTEALGNNRFTTTFEVGEYPDSAGLTLNFVATDNVGIETTSSLGIRIDDQPPWLSLVPHRVRERSVKPRPTFDECSGSFDPLGDEVPDDGDTVQKAVRLRALAWDRARVVSGQRILHYALVDQTSVDLVVQHDTSVPLLINSRGIPGGPCDAVNVRPGPGQTAPVVIELDALPPAGTSPLAGAFVGEPPVFVPDLTTAPDVSQPEDECTPKSGSVPLTICRDPLMPRIIEHTAVGTFPVVYGINYTTDFCSGDFYPNPSPGPLCMVAQARDNVGNASFSWPIRLCVEYDDNEDNVVTCPVDPVDGITSALDGITCTDGCVLPTKFGPDAPDRMPSVLRVD